MDDILSKPTVAIPMVPLGEAIELAYGKNLPKRRRLGGDIPVYGSNGIVGWHNEALVQQPTIIVGRKGSVGAVQYVDRPCFTIDTAYYVKPRSDFNFDIQYLFFLLLNLDLSRLKTATGVPGLTRDDAYRELIATPPIEEQHRIVNILKRADRIRGLRKQAQDTARQLIPALFIDMFGDGGELEGISTATIQELAEPRKGSIRTGPFGSQLKHSEFTDSGIPVIGIDNVVTNKFRWTTERYLPPDKYKKFKRFRVFPGDLIITIMGTTGRVSVAPDDLPKSMSTKHLCVVSLQKHVIQPYYAWAALLFDPYVRRQVGLSGHGAIMEGWNTSIVKNLCLRVPSLELQNEFVTQLESIHTIIRQQAAAQAGAESSFQSLLHRAFSGKI